MAVDPTYPVDMNAVVGHADLLFITLDTLRYDAAQAAFEQGALATLGPHLGPEGWQERHSPGSFTYAAHCAFFAGFLPTPVHPGPHLRPLALAFGGATTIGPRTCVLDGPDIIRGLEARGYHTICIGGTGFFNQRTPLGSDLPGRFAEAHWHPRLGVTDPESTRHQANLAIERIRSVDGRVFLFINVSAIHQPNCHYIGAPTDSLDSHTAALVYADGALAPLFAAMRQRAPTYAFVMSDHGSAYGEQGHHGHRCGLDVVYTVPYAEFWL